MSSEDRKVAEPSTPKDEESDSEGVTCCICMEEVTVPFVTECNHTFCFLCFKNFLMVARRNFSNPSCPLCRAHVDEKKLLTVQMNKTAWDEAQKNSSMEYQWKYSGRKGWWLYDDLTNEQMEDCYTKYCQDHSSDTFEIRILSETYLINFSSMTQTHKFTHRSRNIQRQKKKEILDKKDVSQDDFIKGQAGVHFSRTDSEQHYK